jgi:hypothetical protein
MAARSKPETGKPTPGKPGQSTKSNARDLPPPKNKGGRPPIYKDASELLDDIQSYLDYCDANNRIATDAGFSRYKSISKDTFYSYMNRYSDSIKSMIDSWMLDQTINADRPPGIIAFTLKNLHGWVDTPQMMIDQRTINMLNFDADSGEIDKMLSKLGVQRLPNPDSQ